MKKWSKRCIACSDVEQVTGIEPACSAWEADILPLNYTCKCHKILPQNAPPVKADRGSFTQAFHRVELWENLRYFSLSSGAALPYNGIQKNFRVPFSGMHCRRAETCRRGSWDADPVRLRCARCRIEEGRQRSFRYMLTVEQCGTADERHEFYGISIIEEGGGRSSMPAPDPELSPGQRPDVSAGAQRGGAGGPARCDRRLEIRRGPAAKAAGPLFLSPGARSYPGRPAHGSAGGGRSGRPAHRSWTPRGSCPAPAPWPPWR